jgi:hypothetical protein
MNLKKTALLAEVLGGIGIIVSILYLAFEISENSKNTKISNELILMQLNADVRILVTSDADAAEMILKGSNDVSSLSEVELDRFYMFAQHLFDIWEQTITLTGRDAVESDLGARWSNGYCSYLSRPGYREIWATAVEPLAAPEFRDVVNTCYSD